MAQAKRTYRNIFNHDRNGLHATTVNFENLANAIILTAAEDYRVAYRQANVLSNGKSSQQDCRELERFFRSAWYRVLTDVDGEFLIKALRKQALEELL